MDTTVERLRDQTADFVDVKDRDLAMGDFAVIDFTGAIDGVPISEIVPEASKNLHGGKKFWLHLAPENFLPKFCEQIVGMKSGDTRSVQVEFPADFPVTELAEKKADYAVTLNEIKEKVLPTVDDAFAAKIMPEKTLAELRHTIEHNLEHEKEHELDRAKEQQIVKFLHERISFDLPPSLLKNETRRALNELVHRNRERGVPDEMLKGKEKELIEGAGSLAASSVEDELYPASHCRGGEDRGDARRDRRRAFERRPRITTFRSKKCGRNLRKTTGLMASRKRSCWVRPLIS